jgi:amidase
MTIHEFQPTHYHNTFGSHPPVLTIASGDSVVTSTVDAAGLDASGQKVAEGPNPQTGPFFIQNACPGDVLAVRLDQLAPNRETGWSRTILAPNTLDPERVRGLPASEKIPWQLPAGTNQGYLAAPLPGLDGIAFDLCPMLGCLGVAPADAQAISSATSGAYGGNMDYRGLTAGTTLYFPVFVPGALLHLGDGHALQGDGEVVGTGIETSFAVRFTVELLQGKSIQCPRGENQDYLFSIGCARPLELALQYATGEMLDWLMDGYGLSLPAASTLLGMAVEYDLGNVYDPAFGMVCKLPRRILARLGRRP